MLTTILTAVAIFILTIVGLVAVLMIARSKLVASGEVTIIVNGDESKPIRTNAGSTLLNTLAAREIFIPSACGGKGTCGVCKVDVHEGGGAMLPTEESHISRGDGSICMLSECLPKICRIPLQLHVI